MRIIFLMPTYYPDTFGGAERQTRILSRALRRKGVGVTILAPTMVRESVGTNDEGGVKVVRLYVRNAVFLGGRYVVSMLAWWVRALVWLMRHRDSYDVIAIQHVKLHAWPGLLAGRLFGKILSGKLGRGGQHFELRRLPAQTLPFGRLVVAMAKRSRLVFVANSDEIVRDLVGVDIDETRIARIPNGVECPERPLASHRSAAGRTGYVYAGRLETEKGVDALAAAFAAFASDQSSERAAGLTLFGDGTLRGALDDAARSCSALSICPVTDDRDAIYGGAAFMVLPSESEGMSNTLLEAMAYGVVPIVTGVSGAGDLVVHGKTGFLLAGAGPDAIRRGLDEAAAMDAVAWQAMSLAARQRILDRFSIDSVADAYIALYARLGADRQGVAGPAPAPGAWAPKEAAP